MRFIAASFIRVRQISAVSFAPGFILSPLPEKAMWEGCRVSTENPGEFGTTGRIAKETLSTL